jgi:pyruvate/2-oxoglutarate dehydrogenase complex dihydrolipoamide acyltransferase (E2) component
MTVNKFNLPDVGEGLTEAEIVSWKVKPGDTVAINDVLCEIETAKSLVELPSPFAGTVTELLVPEGITIDVGTAIISVSDAVSGDPTPADVPCTESSLRPTPVRRTAPWPAVRWLVPVQRPTPSSAVRANLRLPRRFRHLRRPLRPVLRQAG